MSISRRKSLALIGGGALFAATSMTGYAVTRKPRTATRPWDAAGGYSEPRMRALSYALLAPNPHNRQPWIADLSHDNEVRLFVDPEKMLPATDPFNRQITIGLGCFLELMRQAAARDGYRVDLTLFPEGENPAALDHRPIAHARFVSDPSQQASPLFEQVLARRSHKGTFDTSRPVSPDVLTAISEVVQSGSAFGGTVNADDIARFRALSHDAMRIEIETPETYRESVDLFRIGHREVDANPDGISFSGPLFEGMHLAGLFTREAALDTNSATYSAGLDAVFSNTDTAMGHVWLTTPGNSRSDQIRAGFDWIRVNLATTALGVSLQPLSQMLQEYPEMAAQYSAIHAQLAPNGGTVQMFGRIGYGPEVGPSPRWPLETKLV